MLWCRTIKAFRYHSPPFITVAPDAVQLRMRKQKNRYAEITMLTTLQNKVSRFYHIFVIVFLLLFPFWTGYSSIDSVNGGRLLFILYMVFFLLCLLLILNFLRNNTTLRITALDVLICVFFIYKTVRIYTSETASISEKYATISLWALYFIFRNIEKSKLPYLLYTLLVSSFIQCLYGQLQLWGIFKTYHSQFGITGSFFNPAPYAGFLSMALPVAFLLFLFRRDITDSFFTKWHIGRIAIITTCLIFMLLPATKSRAAWIATLIVMGVILWHTFFAKKIKNLTGRYRFLFFSSILIVATCAALGMLHLKKDSATGRLMIWQVSAEMVKEKPFFGSGVDSFQKQYMLQQAGFFSLHSEHPGKELADNVAYIYNEPYKTLIEIGIIGLFFIICIGFFLLFPKSEENVFCKISQASLLSLFVFGLFSYPSAVLLLRVYMVLFIAMVACYSMPIKIVKINKPMIYSGILVFCFLVCTPFVMSKMKKYHNALNEWQDGVNFYNSERYVQSINCFDAAFPVLKTDGIFLLQYGKALSLSGNYEQAVTILNKASHFYNNTILYTTLGDCYKNIHQYQKAEESYLLAYNMVPNRLYPIYLLAKLYHETGQSAKLKTMADRVLTSHPKVNSTAIDEMKTEIQQLKEN